MVGSVAPLSERIFNDTIPGFSTHPPFTPGPTKSLQQGHREEAVIINLLVHGQPSFVPEPTSLAMFGAKSAYSATPPECDRDNRTGLSDREFRRHCKSVGFHPERESRCASIAQVRGRRFTVAISSWLMSLLRLKRHKRDR